jgi:hypothetical protein
MIYSNSSIHFRLLEETLIQKRISILSGGAKFSIPNVILKTRHLEVVELSLGDLERLLVEIPANTFRAVWHRVSADVARDEAHHRRPDAKQLREVDDL